MALLDHTSDEKRAVEVYFDGLCPVCRAEISVLKRAAGGAVIAWRDVASGPEHVAPDLGRDAALARFHVRRADGRLVSGAAAFCALWRNMVWLRPLAMIAERWPFNWLAERAYRGFLIIRRLWR